MSFVESDAIVLRHVKQGDTSRVVTLFARDTGKVAVLAKGSRKPGGRFGSGLGLFSLTHIQYRLRPNRDLVFLQACDLRQGFENLTHDVYGYASAGHCVELVDRLVPEGAASEQIFDQLLEALVILSDTMPLPAGEELRAVAFPVAFQMKLMDALGIAPELTGCVSCGGSDVGGATTLSARRGGLLCPRCRAAEGGRRLGSNTIVFLRSSLFGALSQVMTSPRAPTRSLVLESRGALDSVLEYHHHGRPSALRSRKFLDGLWKN
jgi:DNA repair protein RecO (recombination protein O)